LFFWSIIGVFGLFIGIILTRDINDDISNKIINFEKQTFKEALSEGILMLKNLRLLVPAIMISGAAWGIIITYLPLLFQERTNLSLTFIGIIVAIWLGIGSFASFSYGKISQKFGRKKIIIFSYLILGFIGLLLTFITNVILIIGMMLILGIAVFLTYPTQFSFISEVTHESIEGRTFGIIFTLQLGGGTILLFIGGILSDIFGIGAPFFLLGILSVMISILLLVNHKKPYANRLLRV
jgi:MFS family permease